MKMDQVIGGVRDAVTVRRVFGDPYEKNGLTFIPAASVSGGGGGGEGQGPDGEGGEGGGFGISGRPAGAYVIKGDEVRWQPAVDVNRIVMGAQIVAIVALLAVRAIARVRRKD